MNYMGIYLYSAYTKRNIVNPTIIPLSNNAHGYIMEIIVALSIMVGNILDI